MSVVTGGGGRVRRWLWRRLRRWVWRRERDWSGPTSTPGRTPELSSGMAEANIPAVKERPILPHHRERLVFCSVEADPREGRGEGPQAVVGGGRGPGVEGTPTRRQRGPTKWQ